MWSARRWPLSRPQRRAGHKHDEPHRPGDQCLTTAPIKDALPRTVPSSPALGRISGPRPAFQPDDPAAVPPAPRVEVPAAPMIHSLKLRDGDREIEVSGSAAFVRQVLDDLPAMWARLHGEGSIPPWPYRSSRPAPAGSPRSRRACRGAARRAVTPAVRARTRDQRQACGDARPTASAPAERGTPDDKVLAVLKSSTRPLAVAAIRKRLGGTLHAAAGPAHPRAQRPEGLRHRRPAGDLPPPLAGAPGPAARRDGQLSGLGPVRIMERAGN